MSKYPWNETNITFTWLSLHSLYTFFTCSLYNPFKEIAPNAALFTSINLEDSTENIDFSSQTDTADETDVTCLPELLISLFDSTAVNLGVNDL